MTKGYVGRNYQSWMVRGKNIFIKYSDGSVAVPFGTIVCAQSETESWPGTDTSLASAGAVRD
jgi:hypothetical protein